MSKISVYAAEDTDMLELRLKKPKHFFLRNEGEKVTAVGPLCGFQALSENICNWAFVAWQSRGVWPRVSCKNCLRLKRFYEANLG